MTFVLTIFCGFIKLFYDKNRLRKYSKVDKGKRAQSPEMLEAQPVTRVAEEAKDEIPFGIRAIQSGIEVDGVWISRTNTPVGSSRASLYSEKIPRGGFNNNNNSQLELPQPVAQGSSRNSSVAPSSFDRAVSAEPINYDSRSPSPARGQAQAQEAPRCSNCHHSVSPTDPSPTRHTHQHKTSQSSKESSRRTSDESDYMAIGQDVRAYESAYLRPNSHQAPIDPKTDLELLRSHRLSHVAETGQLTPRVRKPGNSVDWASTTDNHVSTVNGVNYFMPQKTPSPPLRRTPTDPEDIPVTTSARPSHDGHISNQARQAIPLTESYAPNAPFYPDTYEPRGPHHQYSYDQVPYEVNTEQNQDRNDPVIRKVNSGFEILRPGTFQPPTPEELELAERRSSKKLQKKRRESNASRKSAFTEQV
ncbi:dna repair rad51 [Pyrenophora seminiperda CCB06]|uniref:Dna repair rad51 n=1 Tax=Pyrenophora seminiperda CCB06 TaxID=1302712 RepID=A0A3M7M2Y1_9PLEO|nr:dna repair rad51 [Pyrenophora seminiperda CCB06]